MRALVTGSGMSECAELRCECVSMCVCIDILAYKRTHTPMHIVYLCSTLSNSSHLTLFEMSLQFIMRRSGFGSVHLSWQLHSMVRVYALNRFGDICINDSIVYLIDRSWKKTNIKATIFMLCYS